MSLRCDSILHRARTGRAANNRQCALPFRIKGERSFGQQNRPPDAANPVLRIPARNFGVKCDRANDDKAEGLANHVYTPSYHPPHAGGELNYKDEQDGYIYPACSIGSSPTRDQFIFALVLSESETPLSPETPFLTTTPSSRAITGFWCMRCDTQPICLRTHP